MTKKLLSTYLLLVPAIYAMAQGIFLKPPSELDLKINGDIVAMKIQDQTAYLAWLGDGISPDFQIGSYDLSTKAMQPPTVVGKASGHPIFSSLRGKKYLLWNDQTGSIQYTALSGGEAGAQHILPNSGSLQLLSATEINSQIVLCIVNSKTKNAGLLVVNANNDLQLSVEKSFDIAKSKNIEFCSAVPGIGHAIKVFWKEQKHKNLLCTTINLDLTPAVDQSNNIVSTEVYQVAGIISLNDPDSQLMVWRRNDKDGKWYYGIISQGLLRDEYAPLPYYQAPSRIPLMSKDENGNFYIGTSRLDRQFVLGSFKSYNPAHWIKDFLLPNKGNYTLKEIVIPGSHDAGMSVLSSAGGKNLSIINECNTLTQVQNIRGQLQSGIRMFDLRLDLYKGELYTKHAPSDCMEDAIAGGYGEKLSSALLSVKQFLKENDREFVILSFCHFCDRKISVAQQADSIEKWLGKDLFFESQGKVLKDITLNDLSGKVLVTFENYSFPDKSVILNTLVKKSGAFINYKRAYAASNDLNKLLLAQQSFFSNIKDSVNANDLVRLDWQLTEAGQEAAFVCNDFQSPKSNPLMDGAKLLLNSIKKNKSIIELARTGNQVLVENLDKWLNEGLINKASFPNILYVDVSGNWITDYSILLNEHPIYNQKKINR
ncbi:phosphatidylinositol-specific phospholipase C domain-containing protein [Pedobacter sp.]|uniref:phosphatidylinositol-specific phospholipase C domain-containing protein n=1 Tax=Pedobacter sp. TaxID=1411316 RepID=UPI003BA895AE